MRGILALTVIVLWIVGTPVPAAAQEVTVCPSCSLQDLRIAVAQARAGSVIRVSSGVYAGPVTIDRPLTLRGEGWPVIDGAGSGTVLTILAPEVHVEGFVIRGSGTSHDREDSGILVKAPRVTVVGNRIVDCLFGIQLLDAPDGLVERNLVIGKTLPEAQRGDGIKLWYSPRARITGNEVRGSRDVLVWYSDGTLVSENTVEGGRYGLHFMYSNDSTIERNVLRDNSVGLYLMYGARQTVRSNIFIHNRGPSGYGLAIKETDGVRVEGNLSYRNRVGLYLDNSPISENVSNHITGNWIAYNDIGLLVSPATRNNVIAGNTFLENLEQALPQGGGQLSGITWVEKGRGNYWSDYAGYDVDRDGVGEVAYRPQTITGDLSARSPSLAFFRFSLVATAVEFAGRALPLFQPPPWFVDTAPLVTPTEWPTVAWTPPERSLWGLLLALAAVAFTMVLSVLVRRGAPIVMSSAGARGGGGTVSTTVLTMGGEVARPVEERSTGLAAAPVVEVRSLTKRYADRLVLDDVHFAVQAGEAVALWGPNGAGKTTILRCLLGRTSFSGSVTVFGLSPLHDGPAVRARIGYVPQQLPLFDMPVGELVATVARLRGESLERAWERLEPFALQSAWNRGVRTLSGGMQQRLALALATIGDPPLLLLDEPTANLDAAARSELLSSLERLRDDGRTIIFASHRPDDVWRLATRVLRIENGRILGETSPERFADRSGAQACVLLELDGDAIQPAMHLLSAHGFVTTRVGHWLRVVVPAERKGEPFALLGRIGVAVRDFRLETGDEW